MQIYELFSEHSRRYVTNLTDATHHGFYTSHLDLIRKFLVCKAKLYCLIFNSLKLWNLTTNFTATWIYF